MTIRDLIENLSGINPDAEAVVVLFKNDCTSEPFEMDGAADIDGTAQIEMSGHPPKAGQGVVDRVL